jgi:hypothetical protein
MIYKTTFEAADPKGLRPHAAGPSGVWFLVAWVSRYVFAGSTLHYLISASNTSSPDIQKKATPLSKFC